MSCLEALSGFVYPKGGYHKSNNIHLNTLSFSSYLSWRQE